MQPHERQDSEPNPQRRRGIQTQPEESLVCSGYGAGVWVGGFKDPMRVAGGCVDFVPPAKADEASASDVLEIIEIGGK